MHRDASGDTKSGGTDPRIDPYGAAPPKSRSRVRWPRPSASRAALARFLTCDGALRDPSPAAIGKLLDAIATTDPARRDGIAVSAHLEAWLAEARRRDARVTARAKFLAEVEAGHRTIDVLRHKLLPYQRDGAVHLAFGERALLADEMGLGKTARAIAACELLRRLRNIGRVLVVCPASLKGEWRDQIERFLGADTLLVTGPRATRLAAYAQPAFFTIVNCEQVVGDAADINRLAKPDIVILDEAQLIKNWHISYSPPRHRIQMR